MDGSPPRDEKRRSKRLDERLTEIGRKTESPEVAQVGTIIANNDMTIGELLAEALEKIGKDGVITVEKRQDNGDNRRVCRWNAIDKGYISPYFINRPAQMDCVLEDSLILIDEKKSRISASWCRSSKGCRKR